MKRVTRVYKSSGTGAHGRSREEFARFFEGLGLIEPGIEVPHRRRPDVTGAARIGTEQDALDGAAGGLRAGVAIKP